MLHNYIPFSPSHFYIYSLYTIFQKKAPSSTYICIEGAFICIKNKRVLACL